MRHVKYLFSTLILLLCSVTASAYDFEVDGIYYNITSEEDLTVEVTNRNIDGASYSGEVVIPSNVTYNMVEYSVTSIGSYAFDRCPLTSITIPESVTSFWVSYWGRNSSFSGCTGELIVNCNIPFGAFSRSNFTKVTIGDSVTTIGNEAFYNCSSLTSITIPESVTSIGSDAFSGCTGELIVNCNIPSETSSGYGVFFNSEFTKVTIGESVTSIGTDAFSGCSSLTYVTIPESVTSIGSSAFYNCTGLTSITIIPESATSIGDWAFSGCSSLTSITIGDSVTSIGSDAFSGCSSLTSITIPESATSIGHRAFEGCSSLTYVTIPESVTSIGSSAFKGCTGELIVNCNISYSAFKESKFTKVTIGDSVTSIGSDAFSGCSSLTSITIPESVTSIIGGAFSGCTGELTVNCNIPSNAFKDSKFTKVTIGDSVTSIGWNAFYECDSLTSITIPESVTSIGSDAFSGCSSLTSITIPESVTSIGRRAFSECTGELIVNCNISYEAFKDSKFTKVTIGDGVTTIENYAFSGCSSLTSITIGDSVTSIGYGAFEGCSSLTSITIPESVTSIRGGAFSGCTGELTVNCNIPSAYPYSDAAFYEGKFTKVAIGDGVTSIGNYAFYECDSLTSITIPESVTSIGSRAFYNCTGELIVNCNIPSYAFEDSKFTKVAIGDGVTSIDSKAFYECDSLTSIVLPKSLETVGSQAFAGCSSLSNVYCYAESVPSAASNAFGSSDLGTTVLHVSESALDSYKATAPWSNFGIFLPLGKYITDIELSHSSITLVEGKTLSLGATLTPEDTDMILIKWSSSDSCVATVDKQGLVKAVAPGTATIIAKTIDGSEVSDSCEVTVLYADYVITYEVDGEVYATDTIGRTSAVTPLAAPIKEGYTFSGWSEVPETMPGYDVTVSGTFTINKYLVNFALDGVVISSSFLEYGTAIVAPEVAEREGYTFSGWQNLLETVPANDTTIIGNFLINSYTVTYVVEEEVYHTDTLAFGSQITAIKYPVKEGYTFSGWSETPEFMPAKDLTITGTFSINSYRITYTVDGVEHHTDSIEYGDTIAVIAAPVKEGYSFSGWSEIPETMPANDVSVSGKFTINRYQITYIVGEDVYHTDSIAYGTYITSIKNPVKEGYTFIEWIDIPEQMPASDVTTIGSFSINKYKVTYTADNVTIYTDSIVYGGQIKDIASPTKEGYSFGGWEKSHQTMPAYDVVINGTFIINKYQISYVVGGETIHTDSITYNERITPIESPEQEGFTFSGWIGVPGIMPAYDVTVGGEFFIKNMQTDSQGLMYVLNEETETFELSNYEGNLTGTIVIPADLYGYPVNGIKERALMGAENLIAVVIPENVSSVGYRAFYGCNNLSYIEWETTAPVDAACFDEPARHGNLLVYVKDAATEVTYQGNVIVDGVAERIAITNEQPLRNIREFTARNITFTRQFTKKTERGVAGGWEAMIIPFDVETVTSENRGELKPFGEADFTTSLPYWIAQLQTDGSFAYIDSIKANRPFIMEVPNCDEYQDIYNVEGAISFGAENVTVYVTTDMNHDMGNGYTMMGNYEGTASDGYVYALNDEEYAADGDVYLPGGVFVADSRDIRPFEAYIYSNQPTAAPYLRIGKKGTTDIDNLLIQRTDDAWYNLQGVRLSGKPTERGVYIINRKKVVID